jgi:hypothetical protein
MKRLLLILLFLCSPILAGCATEREYFFNHNPFTDTLIMVGSLFEPYDPDASLDE